MHTHTHTPPSPALQPGYCQQRSATEDASHTGQVATEAAAVCAAKAILKAGLPVVNMIVFFLKDGTLRVG